MKRRHFLKFSSLSTAPFYISKNSLLGKNAPSNKITIGMIGTGNHGIHRNLNMFLRQEDAKIIAVCDVFKSRMLKAQSITNDHYKTNDCSTHSDFREILERKDIDAVMISTPDHWHALMSSMAIRRGTRTGRVPGVTRPFDSAPAQEAVPAAPLSPDPKIAWSLHIR